MRDYDSSRLLKKSLQKSDFKVPRFLLSTELEMDVEGKRKKSAVKNDDAIDRLSMQHAPRSIDTQ